MEYICHTVKLKLKKVLSPPQTQLYSCEYCIALYLSCIAKLLSGQSQKI